MKDKMYGYMIRRMNGHGEFVYSSGGMDATFAEQYRGKVWKTLGHLKNHLHQFVGVPGVGRWQMQNDIPYDWEVVEYALVPTGVTYNAHELYETADKRREEQRRLHQEREEAATKEQRREQYMLLKKEFEVPDRDADREISKTDVLYHDEPDACNMCGSTYPMSLVRVVCDGGPAKAWLCPCGHAHLAEWL